MYELYHSGFSGFFTYKKRAANQRRILYYFPRSYDNSLFFSTLDFFFLGKIVPFYLKEHTPTTKRLFVFSKNFKKMMAKKNARKNE